MYPHLVRATEEVLATASSDDVSADLRDTLEFLRYELKKLVITVPTHRDLEDNAILLFKAELGAVIPVLDQILPTKISWLAKKLEGQRAENFSADWMEDRQLAPTVHLLEDQEMCASIVSALESFNKCIESQFRTRLRQPTRAVEVMKEHSRDFSQRQKSLVESILSALRKQLSGCKKTKHRILLQAAGNRWKTLEALPISLYLSTCVYPIGWQEIEYLHTQ